MNAGAPRAFTGGWVGVIGIFIAVQILAVMLVIAAEMVPDRWVADALVRGTETGALSEEEYPFSGKGNRLDRWSECIAFTVGLGDPPDSHNVQTALSSPSLGRCENAVPRIRLYAETGMNQAERFYFRYWHGYTTVTRPSLALFGVEGTRTLAMALAAGGVLAAAAAVKRSVGMTVALALTLPFVLTTDFFDIGESVPHAITVAVTWSSGAIVWWLLGKGPAPRQQAAIGMVAGAASSFFEMMFIIPGTLTLHGAVALMQAWRQGARGIRLWVSVLRFGASWFLGFAATWAMKWVAAATTLGADAVLDDVRKQIFNRIGGDSQYVVDAMGAATIKNFHAWIDRPLAPVALALASLTVIGLTALCVRGRRASADYLVLLLLVSLLPLAWYEAVSNHSQVHFWFTYRALAISCGILLAGLVLSIVSDTALARSLNGAVHDAT